MQDTTTINTFFTERARILREILFLLSLPLLLAAGSALLHPSAPSWSQDALAEGEVDLEIIDRWEEDFLWVDARSREEYEEAHIPGALLLNEDAWDDLLFDFFDRWHPGKKVVVYCGSSGCRASHQVAERLRDETGDDTIQVLQGGWDTWREAES